MVLNVAVSMGGVVNLGGGLNCYKKRTDRRWPSHGAQDPLAGRTVGRTLGGRVMSIAESTGTLESDDPAGSFF